MSLYVATACGDQPLITRPADGIVWCSATNGEQQGKLKAVVGEDLSVQSWEIVAD